MQNEPIEVTLKGTGVLETLGISYLIGGLLARDGSVSLPPETIMIKTIDFIKI